MYLQNLLQSLTAAASRPGNQAQLTGPGIAGVGLVQSPAQSAQPRPSTSISVQHLQQQVCTSSQCTVCRDIKLNRAITVF